LLIDSAARWRRIGAHLERGALRAVWVREGEAGDDGAPHPAPAPFAEVLAATTGDAPETPRAPSDVATLIYTSGTTGRPKGVMLSHEAILRNAENVAKVIPPRPEDVFLSVLPLAHAFERTLGYYAPMMGGSRVAFSRSLLRLREDFQEIAPTVLIGVPRLYQKLLSAAFDAAGGFKGRLLRMTAAIGWKRRSGARRSLAEIVAWPLLDRLVTRRFAQAFGGRLRIAVCGGAALPVDVARSLLGLGTPLVEGFGLTEAAPVVTASSLEAYEPGSVGFALPGIALKLSESGELLVRSPSSMLGYWGNEAATAGAFAGDGWLKTGDLAELRDGRVIVVGRARDTLVLLNGENVNPAPIEARLEADPLVDAICVVGHARPFLAALVSLNREAWTAWAAAAGLDPAAPNAPAAQKALLARFREALADLAPYERVRALHADLTPWSVERDLVTPTLKVRRANILRAFAEEIDRFYG
jgi:long-chain acyl-CoA synthetase